VGGGRGRVEAERLLLQQPLAEPAPAEAHVEARQRLEPDPERQDGGDQAGEAPRQPASGREDGRPHDLALAPEREPEPDRHEEQRGQDGRGPQRRAGRVEEQDHEDEDEVAEEQAGLERRSRAEEPGQQQARRDQPHEPYEGGRRAEHGERIPGPW
jgi:hypothetical protein